MIIYKTTNLVNGKIYIGQDKNNNPSYYGSGIKLWHAIHEFGKHNFKKEILEYCVSKNDMNVKEKYWISFYNSTNKDIGYNCTIGGSLDKETSDALYSNSEYRDKLKTVMRARCSNPSYIKRMSDIGKKLAEEPIYRQRLVEQFQKAAHCDKKKEVNQSKEFKEKMSRLAKERWANPNFKEHELSRRQKQKNNEK